MQLALRILLNIAVPVLLGIFIWTGARRERQ